MSIELREMNDEEFEKYRAFSFENFITHSAEFSGKSKEEIAKKMGGAPQRTSRDLWYVVRLNAQPIGWVWVHLIPEKESAFGYDIYLDENYRDQGIGRDVMLSGLQVLKDRLVKTFQICVFKNNARARALYTSLGFKEINYTPENQQYRLELIVK